MRTPAEHLARLSRRVVGITQATLQSHTALWGQAIDALEALRLEKERILRAPGAGAPVDAETRALMQRPIRSLDLRIEGQLAACIAEVESEYGAHGITWRPQWYLGESDLVDGAFWTTDRANSINIPWYLANDQLWTAVNDVRVRYTRDDVMRVLRHESAHAINYAFELWRRSDWRGVFGDFEQPYRDDYSPDPDSTDYVRYLHDAGPTQNSHYAQKHPDEDWAETLAVWLDPAVDWKERYPAGTGARRKLDYVDWLVNDQGACYGTAPNLARGERVPYTRVAGRVGDFVGGWAQSDLWSPSSELLRREAHLETTVRLHDAYFETICGAGSRPTRRVDEAIGGYRRWEGEFRAVCASGNGWAVTGRFGGEAGQDDPPSPDAPDVGPGGPPTQGVKGPGEVRTLLLADGQGPPPGFAPALVVDLAEHSYYADYPNRKDLYVGAVLRNIDWVAVEALLLP